MFTIYAGNELIYAPNLVDEGYAVESATVEAEQNKAGSLEFVMLPGNPAYDKIDTMRPIFTVKNGETEIFRGRMLRCERDFQNKKTIYCEGQLAFLLDSIVRSYDFSGTVSEYFAMLINQHNAQVEEEKRFAIGTVTVEDAAETIVRKTSQYPSTWDELGEKLLDSRGGVVYATLENGVHYINYKEGAAEEIDDSQGIEVDTNLLELYDSESGDSICTVLVPLGKSTTSDSTNVTTYVKIDTVNGGLDYIEDAEAVEKYGRIVKKKEWPDITTPADLLSAAKTFMPYAVKKSASLSANAVEINGSFQIGKSYKIVSPAHNINDYYRCTAFSLDLVSLANSYYTFGDGYKTLTEYITKGV